VDKEEALRQQLEAERQKLTEEQRKRHDDFCASLKENQIYSTKIALEAVASVRDYGVHRAGALRSLAEKAERDAGEESLRQKAARQTELQAEKAKEQKDAQEKAEREERERQTREAENQKKQAQEKRDREEKTLAAQREPVPGTMQRFNAILTASRTARAEKEATVHAVAMDRAAQAAENRPNYARYNELKTTQEPSRMTDNPLMHKGSEKGALQGEVSDAKAEKFQRMFDSKPSRDKDFDATHDPGNSRNFSNGRGGRGR
jgi:hypothetical protein